VSAKDSGPLSPTGLPEQLLKLTPPASDSSPWDATLPMDAPLETLADPNSGLCLEEEGRLSGGVNILVHPGWAERFPWLLQGLTTRTGVEPGEEDFDLGLRGGGAVAAVLGRWDRLHTQSGMETLIHARQVHAATVRVHGPLAPGLFLSSEADGHATRERGLLLTVSLADCVPVFLVAPQVRAVCLLHAGWRGTAAGILEEGIASLKDAFGVPPGELFVHLGPGISGESYEVGPEVHEALGLRRPPVPTPLDLRAVLAERALGRGVALDQITRSRRDTRTDPLLFSHRAGDAGRHLAFLGIRERPQGQAS